MIKINRKVLQEYLTKNFISRREFARQCKLRPNTICDILNKEGRRIKRPTMLKICAGLPYRGIKISELLPS